MLEKVTKITGIGFAVYWMIFTFLEYWQYHEAARRGIQFFQYPVLALILLSLGAVLVFVYRRFSDHPRLLYFSNGLGLILISTLIALICVNGFFYKNLGAFLSISEDLTLLGTLFSVGGGTLLVVLTAYVLGLQAYRIFGTAPRVSNPDLIYLAIGLMVIVAVLFFLGLLDLLHNFVLWPLLLFTLIMSWRSVSRFLKMILWDPVKRIREFSALGLSLLYLILVLLTMNFIQVARPFPTGFDALTYYVNIASLIHDYKGLIQGYGVYNWSLFISLGYLLFNKTSVTLSLAFLGGVLSLFALFNLSRKWLKPDYSLLVVLLFYSLPMISWLSYRDMKVDMGLLFFSILMVGVLMDWLQPVTTPTVANNSKHKKKKAASNTPGTRVFREWIYRKMPGIVQDHPPLILLGLLSGFAIGIKFSALIILLALIPAIAYAYGNRLTFTAATLLTLGGVLLARFDDQAALRSLHLGADWLQWFFLLAGLSLAVYLFIRQRDTFLTIFRMSIVCISLSFFLISPWLIKNAIESKSLSITSITTGENAGPQPSIQKIRQAFENRNNGQ